MEEEQEYFIDVWKPKYWGEIPPHGRRVLMDYFGHKRIQAILKRSACAKLEDQFYDGNHYIQSVYSIFTYKFKTKHFKRVLETRIIVYFMVPGLGLTH